jgi:hypothetical protein
MIIEKSKFDNDVNNALDLIYRNFKLQDNKTFNISADDLRHYNFNYTQFIQVFDFLEKQYGFKILSTEAPIGSDVVVPGAIASFTSTNNFHSLKIETPKDFEKLFKKFKAPATPELSETIYISSSKGVYKMKDGVELAYKVRGKRFELLRILCNNLDNGLSGPGIAELLKQTLSTISRSVEDINALAKKNLNIDNFIIHAREGYKLNSEKYKITSLF